MVDLTKQGDRAETGELDKLALDLLIGTVCDARSGIDHFKAA